MSRPSEQALALAARRARARPVFVAYALAAHQEVTHASDETLAQELGVTLKVLTRLSLCLRPHGSRAAVRAIAAELEIDPDRLQNLLNVSEAAIALRTDDAVQDSSTLLAARSRPDISETDSSGSNL